MTKPRQAPLIGISTYGRNGVAAFSLAATYVDAVRAAGGIPVLLPPGEPDAETLLDRVDGLILSGGGDIDPRAYHGASHSSIYNIDTERDEFEFTLARLCLENDLPFLGICRGMEIAIVACGGTLVTHVPDEYGTTVQHRLVPAAGHLYPAKHSVRLLSNSQLGGIVGKTEIEVVSWHHQAVRNLAPGWRVVAESVEDQVIEAVEHQQCSFAIAVQWHPELSPEDVSHQRIFQALVKAASSRKVIPIQDAIA
jgi:putative glutamine amidotransferase